METPIYQTAFDQMVNSEQSQMLKALIPFLPARIQTFLSLYTKTSELSNTIRLFSKEPQLQMCSSETDNTSPAELINTLQKYCYGNHSRQLEQLNNLLIMIEMLSVMNQP